MPDLCLEKRVLCQPGQAGTGVRSGWQECGAVVGWGMLGWGRTDLGSAGRFLPPSPCPTKATWATWISPVGLGDACHGASGINPLAPSCAAA